MAFVEVLSDIKANVLLNNGTTTTGSVKTITQSLGTMNPANWDIEKIGAIVVAAAPIFSKSVYRIHGVKTYEVQG